MSCCDKYRAGYACECLTPEMRGRLKWIAEAEGLSPEMTDKFITMEATCQKVVKMVKERGIKIDLAYLDQLKREFEPLPGALFTEEEIARSGKHLDYKPTMKVRMKAPNLNGDEFPAVADIITTTVKQQPVNVEMTFKVIKNRTKEPRREARCETHMGLPRGELFMIVGFGKCRADDRRSCRVGDMRQHAKSVSFSDIFYKPFPLSALKVVNPEQREAYRKFYEIRPPTEEEKIASAELTKQISDLVRRLPNNGFRLIDNSEPAVIQPGPPSRITDLMEDHKVLEEQLYKGLGVPKVFMQTSTDSLEHRIAAELDVKPVAVKPFDFDVYNGLKKSK